MIVSVSIPKDVPWLGGLEEVEQTATYGERRDRLAAVGGIFFARGPTRFE